VGAPGDALWDAALWQRFAGELGFAGLAIAPAHGGAGLGPIELCSVAEELGGLLAPIPWFETVLAAAVLEHAGCTGHLGRIASGALTATFALRGAGGGRLLGNIGPRITGGALHGTAHFVPFGAVAELLVVAATEQGGISLFAMPAATAGVRIESLTSMDSTRPLAHVHFDHVSVDRLRAGVGGGAAPVLEQSLALGACILAAEQLGGMQRTLDETIAYSLQREQFGRKIGSFQALKHRMADMKLQLEAARSAVAWAATRLAEGAPDAHTAAAAARAFCTDAYLASTADGIQLHGGIGFTWDHHAHRFFKRARATASLLDTAAVLREFVAGGLLDEV